MDCLDDDRVLRFAQGQLPATEEHAVQSHLSECGDCRHLVAEASRFVSDSAALGHSGSAPTDVNPVLSGTLRNVSRYQLLDVIGAGGMGVVYTAYDPQLSRNIALKLVRSTSTNEEVAAKSRGRLLREAQAMAQLSHPNVVAVYDAGTHEGQVFVAMELVQGDTLKLWLRGHKLGWREIAQVFAAAGEGLAAAHARGLVHRDFKPDNVLVGADGRVRVTDFGLARLEYTEPEVAASTEASLAARPSSMTETGMLLGTPAYMAPEQLKHQPVDARSDQFSFCVALFEALYGKRPYRLTSAELDEIEFPKDSKTPKALIAVLQKGLQRQPADRFTSMNELNAALKQALEVPRSNKVPFIAAGVGIMTALLALVLVAKGPTSNTPSTMSTTSPQGGEDARRAGEVSRANPAETKTAPEPQPQPTPEPVAAVTPPPVTTRPAPAPSRPARHVSKPARPNAKPARSTGAPKPASDDAPIDNPWGNP
ncbi:MAG: protein kinase [Myxococcaceae bacterium]